MWCSAISTSLSFLTVKKQGYAHVLLSRRAVDKPPAALKQAPGAYYSVRGNGEFKTNKAHGWITLIFYGDH